MNGEPAYVESLRKTIVKADMQTLGWSDGWAAPVSVIDAPCGFGEELWHIPQTQTLIAWTLNGSKVISEIPGYAGRATGRSRHTYNLQTIGMPQRYRANGPVKFCHFYITDGLLRRVAEAVEHAPLSTDSLRTDLVMSQDRDLRALLDTYHQRSCDKLFPASRIEIEARALLVVDYLVARYHVGPQRKKEIRGGLAPRQLRRTCEAMEACLDGTFGLDELAVIAGCSPTHFSRAFKQSMGVAPFYWLNERRVERAKCLLEDKRLSLAEIALAVGFSAQPQFTTAFGKSTGMTPGRWRRERVG